MSLNKFKFLFLLIFFCSYRCSKEGTGFHFFNKSTLELVVLSKQELKYYDNGFLSRETINNRLISKKDNTYLGFEEFELKKFKDKNNNIIFFLVKFEDSNNKNKAEIVDSICINQDKISFSES
jgi:hypothetical protein